MSEFYDMINTNKRSEKRGRRPTEGRREGVKSVDYDYIKAILYAYPTLEQIGDAVGAAADNKALLSYRDPRTAEEVVADVLRELATKRAVEELFRIVNRLLGDCSAEERFLLEHKYFRRKSVLRTYEGFPVSWSRRSYFRKQDRLLKKAAAYFFRNGWTQERFLEETNGLFLRVLERLEEERTRLAELRKRRKSYSSP